MRAYYDGLGLRKTRRTQVRVNSGIIAFGHPLQPLQQVAERLCCGGSQELALVGEGDGLVAAILVRER